MANRADAYVRNVLAEKIRIFRKLKDGENDLELNAAQGEEVKIPLPSTEESLVICAPPGQDCRNYKALTKSDVDLEIIYSRTDSCWRIKIIPNNLPSEIPTTVNITIGQEEPG